jgi:hypothetical protein
MTSPKFVYILSQRGAHGADHIVSTLDRGRLPSLLGERWPKYTAAQQPLAQLLGFRDEDLAQGIGHQLTPGTASLQLHVVEAT